MTGSKTWCQGRPAKSFHHVLALALSIKLFISAGVNVVVSDRVGQLVALSRPWWLSLNWNCNLKMCLDCCSQSSSSHMSRIGRVSLLFAVVYCCLPLPAGTYGFPGKGTVTCV